MCPCCGHIYDEPERPEPTIVCEDCGEDVPDADLAACKTRMSVGIIPLCNRCAVQYPEEEQQ